MALFCSRARAVVNLQKNKLFSCGQLTCNARTVASLQASKPTCAKWINSKDLFNQTNSRFAWQKPMHVCQLHTAGDKELTEFLTEEIQYEQKNEAKDLPNVKGFEIVSTDGTNIELRKKLDNETVSVKFNINNTIDDETALSLKESAPEQETDPKMVSKPPFIVEITKGGNSTLAVQCVFPGDQYPGGEQVEGEYEDLIEIEEVALLNPDQKWDEDVYTLSGANMDGNLYDTLLGILEERGVTEDFVNELVQFSTVYEHKKYIHFLKNLQNFASR